VKAHRGIVSALAAILALGAVATEAGAAGGPPINDSYLGSLNLNQPGKPLNRVDTLTDTRDTSEATIQSDIFNPPQSGGPPEVTGCEGVSEGRTIWYDFFPDANGLVRLRTSAAFGTVLAVMPYDPKSLLPDIGQRKCVVNSITHARELFDEVQAGRSYTIQIGGVENAGGTVEMLFDYLVALKRVKAESTLLAEPLSSGIRVLSLVVSAPHKARVLVRCSRGCHSQAQTARTLNFRSLRGTVLPAGSVLRIYVTAKNKIGSLIEYAIRRGSFVKHQRCLRSGTLKAIACE
jgi:hypothetical protein